MNTITHPAGWDAVSISSDFGSDILPTNAPSVSVHYFQANTPTHSAVYRFNVSENAPVDIFHGGAIVHSQAHNDQNWLLPAASNGLLFGSTISLRSSFYLESEYELNLSVNNSNLQLSWIATNVKSTSINFSVLTNLAGGTPPGILSDTILYLGTATSYTKILGPAFAGTYEISVTGKVLVEGETESQVVASTFTLEYHLPVVTSEASISFPDVFTGAARTVTYKNNGKLTVSRVTAVNDNRYAAIRWLASVGVTAGSQSNQDNKTTFRPQDAVNRGAMAQFLQKLAGFTDAQIAAQYAGKSTKLTDIGNLKSSNPARYYAILWLADTRITAGCNDAGTKFCPGNTVTRGAMAEFMRKFVGVAATSAASSPFPDVNSSDKTLKYDGSSKAVKVKAVNSARIGAINWMRTTGITAGSGSSGGVSTFRPHDAVNRGAMAEFMRKLALHIGSTA
jgi:hypothetical protein